MSTEAPLTAEEVARAELLKYFSAAADTVELTITCPYCGQWARLYALRGVTPCCQQPYTISFPEEPV